LVIDRKDAAINLCECKFYESSFEITKQYAEQIKKRKTSFQQITRSKKMLINAFIANEDLVQNEYSLEVVDVFIKVGELM
jgi:hypothetical protein